MNPSHKRVQDQEHLEALALRHVFQQDPGHRPAALHGLEQAVVVLVGLVREVARNLQAGSACTWPDIWSAVKDNPDLVKGSAKVLDAAQGCSALDAKSAFESVLASVAEAKVRRRIEASRRFLEIAETATDATARRSAMDDARELLNEEQDGDRSWPVPIDANTWLEAEPEQSDPIMEGLIDAGDKAAVIAPSKARKSFFSLQLALSVAAGIEFLGFKVPRARKVLVVQFEIKSGHYHRRFLKMFKALGLAKADVGSQIKVLNLRGRMMRKAQDTLSKITEEALILGADLIVLDPFYKLMDGDENAAHEVKPVLKALDRMSEETGAAVLYVHHTGKGNAGDRMAIDRAVGSGVLARDFDAQITITPHRDYDDAAPLLVLDFTVRNYAPTASFSVAFADGKFSKADAVPVVRTSQNSSRGSGLAARLTDEAAMEIIKDWDLLGKMDFKNKLRTDLHLTRDQADSMQERLVRCGKLITVRTPGKHGLTLIGTPEKFTDSSTTSGKTSERLPNTGNRPS